MGDIIAPSLGAHDVALFNPTETHDTLSKLDALIAYAQQVKDWPLLEQAIDAKIQEQRQFVMWWGASVRSAGNPSISAERGKLAMRDTELQTGITNQQVSRWRKDL